VKNAVKKIAGWFSPRAPGCVGITVDAAHLRLARVAWDGVGRPRLLALVEWEHGGDTAGALRKLGKEAGLKRSCCVALLVSGEYQTFQVDAPSVPPEELNTALRWKIKDNLGYPLDKAVVEALLLPQGSGLSTRAPQALVVAAEQATVERRVAPFIEAGIPLAAVDIPELAQRNLSALCEDENRGLAFLHLGEGGGLLTLSFKGELFASRRIEAGGALWQGADGEQRQAALERIGLELQRSLDHFDRQFSFISISRLVLAGDADIAPLAQYLGQTLYLPAELPDWAKILELPGDMAALPGAALPAIGAALRLAEGAV
jgi:MSHA biogenesis protein MshI